VKQPVLLGVRLGGKGSEGILHLVVKKVNFKIDVGVSMRGDVRLVGSKGVQRGRGKSIRNSMSNQWEPGSDEE